MSKKSVIQNIYRLTPLQQGMLFHTLYDNDSAYLTQHFLSIDGDFNVPLFEQSLNVVIARYDILRTIFRQNKEDEYVQIVLKERRLKIQTEDISHMNEAEMEQYVHSYMKNDRDRGFDLSKDLLMRLSVFQLKEDRYQLLWSHHHILMDGWCLSIIINETMQIYHALVDNKPYQLSKVTPFSLYIKWLEKQNDREAQQYWKDYLKDYNLQASVIGNTFHGQHHDAEVCKTNFTFNQQETAALMEIATASKVTFNTLLQTIWGVLLQKYNQVNDVVFGTVVSGRPPEIRGIEDMVGLFINTIPVRIRCQAETAFTDLLNSVQQSSIASAQYDFFPLYEIQSGSELKRGLFNHITVFENYPIAEEIEGTAREQRMAITSVDAVEKTNYDFNVAFIPGRELIVQFIYHSQFGEGYVQTIEGHFRNIVAAVIACPDVRIENIELLTNEERELIVSGFNDTRIAYGEKKTFHELFEEQAFKTPDHVAVVFEEERLTYRELNEQADRLARMLQAQDVKPDTIIAIMAERSLEMVVGMLGILKAGGAYLPVDPGYPSERIRYMLEDSGASLLLIQPHLKDKVCTADVQQSPMTDKIMYSGKLVDLNLADGEAEELENVPLHTNVQPHHLAYVIYTSGSTGKPKGVMVEHAGLTNLKMYFQSVLGVSERDRIVQFASCSFDASVWEMGMALFTGAGLFIPSEETIRHTSLFMEFLNLHQITAATLPPTYLHHLDPDAVLSLRTLVTAGSVVSPELVSRWKNESRHFYNAYGPTEATICATAWFEPGNNGSERRYVPIGNPISNTQVYILDEAGQLQAIGVPGEIYIAGDGLARGYLARPELTAEKFVVNPFLHDGRMYRTGDLGRWQPDGSIEYLGRIDHQVKIRGYRIEPGEIEAHLLRHEHIKETIVMLRQDEHEAPYLCAYVSAEENVDAAELRGFLGKELPGYMIPSFFVQLDKLPLSPNGKIDRQALPAPEGAGGAEYVAPRTALEARLTDIWKSVLGIERIGVKDNFFDLGGHSLKATTLVARMHKELDVDVSLRIIFQSPVLEQLAQAIESMEQKLHASIKPAEAREHYPVSSAQKRMYILNQLEGAELSYNMPGVYSVEGQLDAGRLEQAFSGLIARHESLRTTFELVNGEPVQRVHDQVSFMVERISLSGPELLKEERIARQVADFVRPFDFEKAPLLRVGLIEVETERHLLLFDMHHIISDGLSMNVLVREFARLYDGENLQELRIQYKDYAVWQQTLHESGSMQAQEAFWLETFAGEIPVLELPTDYIRPAVQSFEGEALYFHIEREIAAGLQKIAADTGATMYMVLLAAYTVLLSKYTGQDDIVVGTPIAGRPHADLEPLIGMFVGTLAMRNYPTEDKSFAAFVREVKERTLKAFEHQDYPFEELVEKLDVPKDLSRNPLFDAMFAMQNTNDDEVRIASLQFTPYGSNHTAAKFDITMNAVEMEEAIGFLVQYRTSLFRKETMERMASHFTYLLKVVSEQPEQRIGEICILPEQERQLVLYEFNAAEADYPQAK
ncbi:bacitracin synthetase 1, partial [Paenibacillus alvei TS-15]